MASHERSDPIRFPVHAAGLSAVPGFRRGLPRRLAGFAGQRLAGGIRSQRPAVKHYELRPRDASAPAAVSVSGDAGKRAARVGLVNGGISERSSSGEAPGPNLAKRAEFLDYCYNQAPIRGFRPMKNDVVTVRIARNPEELAGRLDGSERGKIEFLSMASRKRLALVAGNSPVTFRSFLTATYPAEFPCDGLLVKRHLHALLAALRRRIHPLEYLWILEFQARDAPHFHIFLDHALPEPHATMKRRAGGVVKDCLTHWPSHDWLAERWFSIVGSGDERHLAVGTAWEVIEKAEGCPRYVAKECYKTFQKVVPEKYQSVGRFWGCSRGVTPPEGPMVFASEAQIRKIFPASADADGVPFPVMFSAAENYRKIKGTKDDPDRIRKWQTGGRAAAQKEFDIGGESVREADTANSPIGRKPIKTRQPESPKENR